MGKSIRTTSNTQATTNTTLATFKAGDSVLCPSLSLNPFVLTADPYGKRDTLAITHDGSNFYYDEKGYSVSASDTETGDYQPSLFQDTPANRQAIAALYSGNQSNQRKVIDTTEADDNIVVTMSSHGLSHIASDIHGAANALHDVGYLLGLIYYGKIEGEAVKSMARLAHDATNTWEDILRTQLDIINEPLAMTGYSKVGAE